MDKLPTIASIATTGDRPKMLKNTINSLKGQVDILYIYDNSKNKDLGALGKFYPLQWKEDCYFFTCDDDIIYPRDYVKRTLEEIKKRQCIISYHGRVIPQGAEDYYSIEGWRFFQPCEGRFLDIGGTGVMAFDTRYFKPQIWSGEYKKCADLTCAIEAKREGKRIYMPEHEHLWIIPQESMGIMQEMKGRPEPNELLKIWKQMN